MLSLLYAANAICSGVGALFLGTHTLGVKTLLSFRKRFFTDVISNAGERFLLPKLFIANFTENYISVYSNKSTAAAIAFSRSMFHNCIHAFHIINITTFIINSTIHRMQ